MSPTEMSGLRALTGGHRAAALPAPPRPAAGPPARAPRCLRGRPAGPAAGDAAAAVPAPPGTSGRAAPPRALSPQRSAPGTRTGVPLDSRLARPSSPGDSPSAQPPATHPGCSPSGGASPPRSLRGRRVGPGGGGGGRGCSRAVRGAGGPCAPPSSSARLPAAPAPHRGSAHAQQRRPGPRPRCACALSPPGVLCFCN